VSFTCRRCVQITFADGFRWLDAQVWDASKKRFVKV
jgi:hypothetical protein